MKRLPRILLLSLVAGITAGAAVTENHFTACSLLGGAADSVCGARIQSDGSIVLAANVSAGPVAVSASGATTAGKGMVVRLTPGGTRLLSARPVADEVRDLALDAQDKDLRGQEFTGRLSSGRANAVRVKNGTIAAGADGSLFVGGTAASGLPVSFTPPGTGDYAGGGFLLGLNPALDTRLFCARLQPGAVTHAVDVRLVNGKTVVICGGSTSTKPEPFWTQNAIQSEAPPNSGFFAVFTME
ncbi:MAG: hypothetical protein JXQ71_15895 [Verrucomicrobia bacterium]|nr:hypothetical protein [Verrucomicrobiota bacterium]